MGTKINIDIALKAEYCFRGFSQNTHGKILFLCEDIHISHIRISIHLSIYLCINLKNNIFLLINCSGILPKH